MIRKLKVYIINQYALNIMNQNLVNKSNKLLKLDYNTIMNLKKRNNLELFNLN